MTYSLHWVLDTQKIPKKMLAEETGIVPFGISVIQILSLWYPNTDQDGANGAWAAQNPVGRFGFVPNLASLTHDFHIAGGQFAGVNCEAGGNPYDIWPWYLDY